MKCFLWCVTWLFMCITVLFYAVTVIAGYVFDAVHSYGGPTPMALDTAISLLILSAGGAIGAGVSMRKVVR